MSLENDNYNLAKMLKRAEEERDWYKRRVELLGQTQQLMRDPERTIVCDILANGQLLPDPHGKRYGFPATGKEHCISSSCSVIRWRCPSCGCYRATLRTPDETELQAINRIIESHINFGCTAYSLDAEAKQALENPFMRTMKLCPICGNKRCPKATDEKLNCTNSNEPGQPGSAY